MFTWIKRLADVASSRMHNRVDFLERQRRVDRSVTVRIDESINDLGHESPIKIIQLSRDQENMKTLVAELLDRITALESGPVPGVVELTEDHDVDTSRLRQAVLNMQHQIGRMMNDQSGMREYQTETRTQLDQLAEDIRARQDPVQYQAAREAHPLFCRCGGCGSITRVDEGALQEGRAYNCPNCAGSGKAPVTPW